MTPLAQSRAFTNALTLLASLLSAHVAAADPVRTTTTQGPSAAQSSGVTVLGSSPTLDPKPNTEHAIIVDAIEAIARKRAELPWLGARTSEVEPGGNTKGGDRFGFYRHFEAGSVFWIPGSPAFEVHGAIREPGLGEFVPRLSQK
jgi:hypothetical protein